MLIEFNKINLSQEINALQTRIQYRDSDAQMTVKTHMSLVWKCFLSIPTLNIQKYFDNIFYKGVEILINLLYLIKHFIFSYVKLRNQSNLVL